VAPNGLVESWVELVSVGEGRVRFEGHNIFSSSGEVLVARSELRFRSLEELTHSLTDTGFTVEQVYGDWNKGPLLSTSRVMIFVARRDGGRGGA
jgi:hypothetical protein